MASKLLLSLHLLTFTAAVLSLDGFDLEFNSDSYVSPRALLLAATQNGQSFSMLPRKAFTFCFFVFVSNTTSKEPTFVSYSSEETGNPNEVYLEANFEEKEPYMALSVGTVAVLFHKVPAFMEWTHVCTSWEGIYGKARLFLNGREVKGEPSEINKGYSIGEKGYLVLGNDQDGFNSYFDPAQGVKGRMTQFNIWSKELTKDEVNNVRRCQLSGDVANWSTTRWGFYDQLELQPSTAPCFNSCGEIELSPCNHVDVSPYDLRDGFEDGFPKQVIGTLKNVAIPDMTECTFCFHLRSNILYYAPNDLIRYEDKTGNTHLTFGFRRVTSRDIGEFYWILGTEEVTIQQTYLRLNSVYSICLAWSGITGTLQTYFKGEPTDVFDIFKTSLSDLTYFSAEPYQRFSVGLNRTIPGNGKLKVFQEQDSPLNIEKPYEGFRWKLTNLYMWNRLLTDEDVEDLNYCIGFVKGYLVAPKKSEWGVESSCPDHSTIFPEDYIYRTEFDVPAGSYKETIFNTRGGSFGSKPKEPNVKEVSICSWMYMDAEKEFKMIFTTRGMALYANTTAVTFFLPSNEEIKTSNDFRLTSNFLKPKSWNHVCSTWSATRGESQLFINGDIKANSTDDGSEFEGVSKDDTWLFNIFQNGTAEKNDPIKGFAGKVTDVNIWDYVLSDNQVMQAYECSLVQGNIKGSRNTIWALLYRGVY